MSQASEPQAPILTKWVVITGPPSSGKTTLLDLLAAEGETTSGDSTRELIAEVVASGRDAEEFRFADDFQPKVLEAMLAAEQRLDPDETVFLEYGLPCNIAFHRTESLPLTEGLNEAADAHRYSAVFICEPVGWENDAERVEDEQYQQAVHAHMFEVYRERGYKPVAVPAVSPAERLAFLRSALGENALG